MSESLILTQGATREVIYTELVSQMKALVAGEPDQVANMANFCAVLKEAFGFFWVGFYLVKDNELVLGPFQGPLACTRIKRGKGVCGAAWDLNQSQLVPDVDAFPGHIACSSASKSEVVIPITNTQGEVIGVLDVDSDKADDFSEIDVEGLTNLLNCLEW